MTPEMLAALGGLVMFCILQVAKKTGWPSEVLIVITCAIAGVLYAGFKSFIPPDLQEHTLAFLSIAFSTSWVLYAIVYKPYKAIQAASSEEDTVEVHEA